MKEHTEVLSHAIKEIPNIIEGLRKESKTTEEHVHQVFDELRLLLNEREAALIGDIEQKLNEKEKAWEIQRDDLVFLFKGIRDSVEFSQRLVAEGSHVEVVNSQKPVMARFETLEGEMKKAPLSLVSKEFIRYEGVESAKKQIQEIGNIEWRGPIEAGKSVVWRGEANDLIILNQKDRFDVTLCDKHGDSVALNPLAPLPTDDIQVMINGQEVKVIFIDSPGLKLIIG